MGLWNGIGNGIGRKKSGINWSSYWKTQSEVLFFGLYSEIVDGKMPNKKAGASDFLTVAGVAGSETYQAPNTAPYIAADTDYIWFKSDGTQRTTTTAELIGYDLQRTPVKYEDDSPNEIVAIIILSAAVTGDRLNYLFRDMWLPIEWQNNTNAYGHLKSNRVGQNLWTPEVVFCDEYQTLYDAYTTAPSDADAYIQNTAIKALVDGGYWAKLEIGWLLGSHEGTEALKNIKKPGTFDATKNNTPAFVQYKGYTGSNDLLAWLNTGWIAATHATVISQNSVCLMLGVGTDYDGDFFECGIENDSGSKNLGIRPRYGNKAGYFCNDARTGAVDCTSSIAHYAVSRNNATTKDTYINKAKTVISRASVGLPTKEFVICAQNLDGTIIGGKRQIRYCFIFSYLTETEVSAVIDILEAYFDNYSAGLM